MIKFAIPALVFVVALVVFATINRESTSAALPAASEIDGAEPPARSTDALIRSVERKLRAQPLGASALYASLGDLYYQRGRETADSAWNEKALEAYRAALRRDPANAQATLGLGTLALAKHDFAGGLRYGTRALRLDPGSPRPYAVIADAQLELGRYDAAARSIQRMVDLKPNLASYSRVSYFRELHGDLDGALEAMRLAVSAGGQSPENVAYVESLLGNLHFQRGEIARAERAYRSALARMPDHLPAHVGLAQVEAVKGKIDAAIRRLSGVIDVSAVHEYSTLLMEAQLAAGRRSDARRTMDIIREAQALERSRGVNTDAELAIFEAEHGSRERAVALGRSAVRVAPSVGSADAYAWALAQAGRGRQALAWARKATRLGWRDPLVLYHAGIAAKVAGDMRLARRWLTRSLQLNPRFSPLHAPHARQALRVVRRRAAR